MDTDRSETRQHGVDTEMAQVEGARMNIAKHGSIDEDNDTKGESAGWIPIKD